MYTGRRFVLGVVYVTLISLTIVQDYAKYFV